MADIKENEMLGGTPEKARGIDASGNSILFSLSEIGVMILGNIPAAGVNIVGNPSEVKEACYGWYNNVNGNSENSYAPVGSAGLFLRLYHSEGLGVTIFFGSAAYGKGCIWILPDGETHPIQV